MKKSDLVEGEIYAYSVGSKNSTWRTTEPVRLLQLDGAKEKKVRPFGGMPRTEEVRGILVEFVDDKKHRSGDKVIVVESRNLWRLWSEQQQIDATAKAAREARRAANEAALTQNDAARAELLTILPFDVWYEIGVNIRRDRMEATPEQMLQLFKAVHRRALGST